MLEQFLQPQLFADNILDFVVFQQDDALLHFAHIVRNYLNETVPRTLDWMSLTTVLGSTLA